MSCSSLLSFSCSHRAYKSRSFIVPVVIFTFIYNIPKFFELYVKRICPQVQPETEDEEHLFLPDFGANFSTNLTSSSFQLFADYEQEGTKTKVNSFKRTLLESEKSFKRLFKKVSQTSSRTKSKTWIVTKSLIFWNRFRHMFRKDFIN